MLGWALLADAIPLYPLYALLFADSGLSGGQISALFAIWSAVGLVVEVPTGALADRFGRRTALAASGVFQAAGYVAWILVPTLPGFAAGFVLWGIGGSLVSGAREALLFDGLAAAGAQEEYARVNGRVGAALLVAELPAAAAATLLFPQGGYALVGWVSVGVCLAAAAVAMSLPEPPPATTATTVDEEPGYLDTLQAGVREAAARPAVRAAVVAAALVGAFDSFEEYFPLITEELGVPVTVVPLAMLPIGLAGAVGSAVAGRVNRLGRWPLGLLLGAAMLLLAATGFVDRPAAVVGIAAFYGVYRAVLVVVDARLQERIGSGSRATVTSVAGLGVDIASFAVYAAWAAGEVAAVAALGVVLAVVLPLLLRERVSR